MSGVFPTRRARHERLRPGSTPAAIALLVVALAAGPALAQAAKSGWDGNWPMRDVVRTLIADTAQKRCLERYDLNEKQCGVVSNTVANQWSEFLDKNRDVVQPVLDEFVEMQFAKEPPSKARVQRWAEHLQPVLDRLQKHLAEKKAEAVADDGTVEGMQRELDLLNLESGVRLVRSQMSQWKSGNFDAQDFKRPRPTADAGPPAPAPIAPPSANAAPAPAIDPVTVELLGWARYVNDFMERYQLDAGQRDAALSCLVELTSRASAHRERHADEIADLERRINTPQQTADEKTRLAEDVLRLYGPIDEMFSELQHRIEEIPTAAQRDRVKTAPDAAKKDQSPSTEHGQ